MNRSEFIRLGLLGLIATVLPATLVMPEAEALPERRKWCITFKVTDELLKDKDGFEMILNHAIEETKPPDGYTLKSVEIGMAGGDEFTQPDFVLNCFTVLLTFL